MALTHASRHPRLLVFVGGMTMQVTEAAAKRAAAAVFAGELSFRVEAGEQASPFVAATVFTDKLLYIEEPT